MSWKRLAALLDGTRHRIRLKRWDREHASGRRAEDLAHRYLEKEGFTVVARNYRRRAGRGEVDLVAWDGPTLVFVEVKARSNDLYRSPEAAMDREKRAHLVLTAAEYLRRSHIAWEKARFDLVTVVLGHKPDIKHIRDAFARRSA